MADDLEYPGVDLEDERRKPWATPPLVPSPGGADMMPPAPEPAAPDMNAPAPQDLGAPLTPFRQPPPPARPTMADFPVQKSKHPWLQRLAVGAAAFGSPEQGAQAAHRAWDVPREQAVQQYQAATGAYDTEMNQGLAQRREIREQSSAESQSKLREAQAAALEPKVMVKVPWQDELIPMSQKGAEAYYKTQQQGVTTEKVTGEKGETARDVAHIKADATAKNARQPIRVMGDRTYERTPDGTWKDIGKAPARTEPGNYAPINDEGGATVGWVNPKSGHMVRVDEIAGLTDTTGGGAIPPKPSGTGRSRQEQAAAIDRASTGLINTIEAHKNKIGNVEAILKAAFLNTPLADAELSGVASEIQSYAALQPAMHGFRGQDALREFSHMIGGIPKDPDALIAAIKGIQKTAGYINPKIAKKQPAEPAAGGAPRTAADYLKKKGVVH